MVKSDIKVVSARLFFARKSSCELRIILPCFALMFMVNRGVNICGPDFIRQHTTNFGQRHRDRLESQDIPLSVRVFSII